MHPMKGKLILLAGVSLNLLVMCTYGESASSVKSYQSNNISTRTVRDNNSTVYSPKCPDSVEDVNDLHLNGKSQLSSAAKYETVTSSTGETQEAGDRDPESGVKSVSIPDQPQVTTADATDAMLTESNGIASGQVDGESGETTRPQYLSDDGNDSTAINGATTDSSLFLAHGDTSPSSDPMDNANLFQGDIVNGVESKTAVRIFNLWPLGIIPYSIDLTLLPIRDRIKAAMSEIESKTCVRFVPRLLSRDYISIGSGSGCYSNIGRQGGGQVLSLGRGCSARNTILHELLHAVGFEHMHSHRDRDLHLRILWENIPRDKWRQFEVVSLLGYKAIIPFDYESVMLYGPKTFGEDGKVTMESKRPDKRVMEMSEKPGLSRGDIDGINRLYFCRRSASTGQWIHVASRK